MSVSNQLIERYWDYCSTTPIAPRVLSVMQDTLANCYANPASSHRWGNVARERVEDARYMLGQLLNVQSRELYFTSGATESNQLAILGGLDRVGPHHIITQKTEHSAVLKPINHMVSQGCEQSILSVDSQGLIDVDQLKSSIKPETRLISIMHINNELGTIQPIAEIGECIAQYAHPDCLFHVDGAQSTGKIDIDLAQLNVDLFSLSAHKFYGPKGVGALYVRRRSPRRQTTLKLSPLSFGGGQERGLRPGTLATHQIVGLGMAAQEAQTELNSEGPQRTKNLINLLFKGLVNLDPSLIRRGTGEAPHVLSVTLSPHVLEAIEECWSHIAFSRGSACRSSTGGPSPILTAIGLSSEAASHTCRFGLGRFVSTQEIEENLILLSRHLKERGG
jgi:cysteine desulfurase